MTGSSNGNFDFVDGFDEQVARLARQAESYVHSDPESCLFKLRLMIELMARRLVELQLPHLVSKDLGTMLKGLERVGHLPRRRADRMHAIRRDGNAAVHGKPMPIPTAMRRLRDAHALAQWFCKMLRRGAKLEKLEFIDPPPPGPLTDRARAAMEKAELLESEIEQQRNQTREALLLFGGGGDPKRIASRLTDELEALARVAAAAGEPLVDADSVVIIMAMELEHLLNDPRLGLTSREAQHRAESQLEAVRQQLEDRELAYENERAALAEQALS